MNRYSRHENLLGPNGLDKLKKTTVLVAGAGGLGSHVLQLLVRAGFGIIHVYDPGISDEPDLNRQLLYDVNSLAKFKVDTVMEKLSVINPEVDVQCHNEKLTDETVAPEVDLVIDCLDNFTGRMVIERLFFDKGIPFIHGGATSYFGQVTTLIPGRTMKLSDIFGKDISDTDDNVPKDIFPATVMNVASIQVSEAIKLVCGLGELLENKLLTIDVLNNSFEVIDLN